MAFKQDVYLKCRRLAKKLGVEIDTYARDAWAPKGYVFASTGTHVVVFDDDGKCDWEGLLADLEMGLEPCRDPNCDVCRSPLEG